MYYVKNERDGKEIYDASTNLAIEYFLLNKKLLDEPILLFYINEPSIIIGKNQNTHAEVNQDYVNKHHIRVVRRFSGGGAVYHDLGNICFCFITKDDGKSFRDFKRFTTPVIDALHDLGATGAKLEGRNDLMIDGQKFSGNAMYSTNGRLTAHGTLMLDVDIDVTTHALIPKKEKLKSKGIKSIRKRVTNIRPYLNEENQNIDIHEFRTALLKHIFQVSSLDDIKEYQLTDDDWKEIDEFKATYTGNDDWNYGKNPDYKLIKEGRTAAGQIEFHFNISNEKIQSIKIYGDFFGLGEISDVEQQLVSLPYTKDALTKAFDQIDIKKFFGQTSTEELVNIMI